MAVNFNNIRSLTLFSKETRALQLCTWVNLGMLAFSVIAFFVDGRMLLGENVWLKPIKFGISIPIYCVTISLLLSIYPYTATIKKQAR